MPHGHLLTQHECDLIRARNQVRAGLPRPERQIVPSGGRVGRAASSVICRTDIGGGASRCPVIGRESVAVCGPDEAVVLDPEILEIRAVEGADVVNHELVGSRRRLHL